MLSSTQAHSFGTFACRLASHCAMSRRTGAELAAVVEPAQLAKAIVIGLARNIIERVAQEMHITALPDRLGKNLADRGLEPRMIVRHDELDAFEATALEARKASRASSTGSPDWPD